MRSAPTLAHGHKFQIAPRSPCYSGRPRRRDGASHSLGSSKNEGILYAIPPLDHSSPHEQGSRCILCGSPLFHVPRSHRAPDIYKASTVWRRFLFGPILYPGFRYTDSVWHSRRSLTAEMLLQCANVPIRIAQHIALERSSSRVRDSFESCAQDLKSSCSRRDLSQALFRLI